MKSAVPLLVQRLLATIPTSSEWDVAEDVLVNAVLKWRKIAKNSLNRSLEGPYQQMYADLQDTLTISVHQAGLAEYTRRHSQSAEVRKTESIAPKLTIEFFSSLLSQASREILTYDRLTQLAVHLQAQRFRSPDWHYALNELFNAVYLSKKLKPPKLYGENSREHRLDITNAVLMQAIEDIQRFDPTRAHFIGWINQVYIGKRSIDVLQRQQDTLKQGHHKRVMPIKYAISRSLGRADNRAARQQLIFYVKGQLQTTYQTHDLIFSLVICLLQRHIQDAPQAGHRLLFNMAELSAGRTIVFENIDVLKCHADGSQQMAEIASPVLGGPPEIDFLRECLQSCPFEGCADILKKHIKSNSQASFSEIALWRTEGRTLKEISHHFKIPIPTIQKFYERNMSKAVTGLKTCVEDKIALWEMQHPYP